MESGRLPNWIVVSIFLTWPFHTSKVSSHVILAEGDSDFSTSKWLGDHLVISSNSGGLYIQYVDEEKIEPALLKTLKGLVSGNAQVKNLLGGAKWIMKDKIGGRRQY